MRNRSVSYFKLDVQTLITCIITWCLCRGQLQKAALGHYFTFGFIAALCMTIGNIPYVPRLPEIIFTRMYTYVTGWDLKENNWTIHTSQALGASLVRTWPFSLNLKSQHCLIFTMQTNTGRLLFAKHSISAVILTTLLFNVLLIKCSMQFNSAKKSFILH